jgi:hypothetical protein
VELTTTARLVVARRTAESRQWTEAIGILRVILAAAAAVVLVVAGYQLLQQLFNRVPSESALTSLGAEVGATLRQRHSSEAQPLEFAEARPVLQGEVTGGRARYEFSVTLRLREPLFAPAESNGTQAYRDLQRTVFDLQGRLVQSRLYSVRPDLAVPPTLPLLLARTHRAGERLTVVLPVAAVRRVWGWQLAPQWEQARMITPPLHGTVLAQQPARHLIFGTADGREAMAQLQRAARDYVLQVQRALAAPR